MYRSILNPPWEPIDVSDFKDAPNLVLNGIFDANERPDEHALDLWNRHVGHSPAQIYDLFAGGFGQENIRLDIDVDEGGLVKLDINEENGKGFLTKLWLLTGDSPDILYSKIYVNENAQGMGIGRTAMRNKVEIAATLGFTAFPFEAGLDNGGHVWAKMGGHLDRDQERVPFYKDYEEQLSLCLTARLEAARPFIGKENYEKAFTLCQLQRPDDLVALAQMGGIVVPKSVVDEACAVLPRVYYGAIGDGFATDAKVKHEIKNLSSMFYGPASGETDYVRFPHYMQNETVWSGVFDFADDAQMEYVGNYVGGWRILEQEPVRQLAVG